MVAGGSLQLSPGFRPLKHHGRAKRFSDVDLKHIAGTLSYTLSSHASQRDGWGLKVAENIYKPQYHGSYRYHSFLCQSSSIPSSFTVTPLLKKTNFILVRSCNTVIGNPFIFQLVSSVVLVTFALWGLKPLTRYTRKFLKSEGSDWKKSGTYHVLSSYVRPFLLWTSAIIICRTLDPLVLPTEASHAVKQRLLNFVRSLSTVLASAYCLSSLIQQTQRFLMEKSNSNDARNMGFQFAGKAVYTSVWVAAVSLFMELLGFSTQRWITAGGLGTVLITLAGREIFTNFLSSIMIHATRPFVLNEWIQTKIEGYEVSGIVEHIGWWSPTLIRGDDREAIHIPNHKFTVNVVRNLTQRTHWRIKTHLAISHLDANKINNIVSDMRKVLVKNPQVEQQRLHRRVFLENINPENQSLLILISCFVKTPRFEEYLRVKEAILLDLLRVISHHRARLATPIRTVHNIYSDAEIENIPFAETIFHGSGAVSSRPLLLVEPPSRINGDDKAKSSLAKVSEDQLAKSTALPDEPKTKTTEDASHYNSDKQSEKQTTTEDALPKGCSKADFKSEKLNPPKGPSRSHLDGFGVGLESKENLNDEKNLLSEVGEHAEINATKHHAKHGSEGIPASQTSASRPALEENIFLGVALERSKLTLPIEHEIPISVIADV